MNKSCLHLTIIKIIPQDKRASKSLKIMEVNLIVYSIPTSYDRIKGEVVTIRFHSDKNNLDEHTLEELHSALTDWRFLIVDVMISVFFCILFIILCLSNK